MYLNVTKSRNFERKLILSALIISFIYPEEVLFKECD